MSIESLYKQLPFLERIRDQTTTLVRKEPQENLKEDITEDLDFIRKNLQTKEAPQKRMRDQTTDLVRKEPQENLREGITEHLDFIRKNPQTKEAPQKRKKQTPEVPKTKKSPKTKQSVNINWNDVVERKLGPSNILKYYKFQENITKALPKNYQSALDQVELPAPEIPKLETAYGLLNNF